MCTIFFYAYTQDFEFILMMFPLTCLYVLYILQLKLGWHPYKGPVNEMKKKKQINKPLNSSILKLKSNV